MLQVELIYAATPSNIWRQSLQAPVGASIADVLRLSDFEQVFPNLLQKTPSVGVYGQNCALDRLVANGDRIEIYRPLHFDPMESRRRRAEHKRKQQEQSTKGTIQ